VEVEELTPQRIDELLKPIADKLNSGASASAEPKPEDGPVAEIVSKIYPDLNETLEAVGLDDDQKELFKVPISELVSKISTQSGVKYLVLDGIITQRLLEGAKSVGIECVIGHRVAKLTNQDGITLKTFTELGVV